MHPRQHMTVGHPVTRTCVRKPTAMWHETVENNQPTHTRRVKGSRKWSTTHQLTPGTLSLQDKHATASPGSVDVTDRGLSLSELYISVEAVSFSPFITKQREKAIPVLVTSPIRGKPIARFVKDWVVSHIIHFTRRLNPRYSQRLYLC